MKENKLIIESTRFSINVLKHCENIKKHPSLVNQLERAATSIGANIYEAQYAQSKVDFISKLQISLKECYETEYWINLFNQIELLQSEETKILKNQCGTIRRLLIASINTATILQGKIISHLQGQIFHTTQLYFILRKQYFITKHPTVLCNALFTKN